MKSELADATATNTKKGYWGYWVRSLLLTMLVLPILLQAGFMAVWIGINANKIMMIWKILFIIIGIILILVTLGLAFWYGKKTKLPDTFLTRYGVFLIPIVMVLLAWQIIAVNYAGDSEQYVAFYILLPFVAYGVFAFVAAFSGFSFSILIVIAVCQAVFTAMFAFGTWRRGSFITHRNKLFIPSLSLILGLTVSSSITTYVEYYSIFHEKAPTIEVNELPVRNRNADESTHPRQIPSLRLENNFPRLDGAIALLPVYGEAAKVIYAVNDSNSTKGDDPEVIKCTNTPSAYERLISGETDMIFVAAPSDEQQKRAAQKGVVLTLTPIAKEAFVFLINEQNPVKNMSVDQIRAIYSGEINNWKKLGGLPEKILAFQRNEDSGSQTTMEQAVMRGIPMRMPLKTEYHDSMGGMIRAVADYRNYRNAIGYSFRYYATAMNSVPGVALLSVNGIVPTAENIRNGSYPFISDVYIVTARPLSENAKKLRDWFLSGEGQQFIADAGYVPIRDVSNKSLP
jgi:phosphate transport system substrate-binding protein